MTRQRKAELLLILATAFWGVSYYLTDVCFAELEPLMLNAIRFTVAFLVLGAAVLPRIRRAGRATWRYSVLLGLVLTVVYLCATYGVKYTSLSNAGFLSTLVAVFTPLLQWIVYRKVPERKARIALALCVIGLALLSLNEKFLPAGGDVLCLMCSVSYAVDILIMERAVVDPAVDPIALGVLELGVVGLAMLGLALLFEQPRLPRSAPVWAAALFLALFCSGISFLIQASEQRYTSATRVSLIFTLEPVFAALVAFFVAGERLRPRGYLGAALMLASLLTMEIDWENLKGGKRYDDV